MDRARRRIHSSGTVAELFPGYVADYEIPADVGIPLRCGRPRHPCVAVIVVVTLPGQTKL